MPPSVRACCLFASLLSAYAAEPRSIVLVLQFEQEHSAASVDAMKREFDGIMQRSGLRFDYKLRSELSEFDTAPDIVLVKFEGQCRMKFIPELLDERGPFASTYVTDDEIQPFSRISCDRVRVSIRSSMTADHLKKADLVLGRALGRVLAHEVYHILSKSKEHGRKGIARHGLTSSHLIADDLAFDPADAEKMYSLP